MSIQLDRDVWRRLFFFVRGSPTLAIGATIILAFALAGLLAPWLAPYDPIRTFPDYVLVPPDARFRLGTDDNGMDVLSRTIHGARYAFAISVPVLSIGMIFGVPLGLYAGYSGGWVDEVSLRVMDSVRIFPSIVLALAIVAATGPSLLNLIIAIAILDIPVFARLVRAEVLAARAQGFIEAAVAAGNPTWRVLALHLLPNAIRGALAQIPIRMAWAVRVSATLAFIGVGVQVPTPEWGAMIRQGAESMISGQWWVSLVPGGALVLLIIGLSMLGDGLDDMLDPRRRQARG